MVDHNNNRFYNKELKHRAAAAFGMRRIKYIKYVGATES